MALRVALLTAASALPQVEKAPVVIKSGMKKEEAEALKLKLEAGKADAHSRGF